MGLNEIKKLLHKKRNSLKLKSPFTEWEKIFASRIHRNFKKLSSPKNNEPIKNWATELNRTFSKEKSKWPKSHEKCSSSLAIKELQIKTTLRFHLTPVRIARNHQQQ
jgi:hypothetical protein